MDFRQMPNDLGKMTYDYMFAKEITVFFPIWLPFIVALYKG